MPVRHGYREASKVMTGWLRPIEHQHPGDGHIYIPSHYAKYVMLVVVMVPTGTGYDALPPCDVTKVPGGDMAMDGVDILRTRDRGAVYRRREGEVCTSARTPRSFGEGLEMALCMQA